MMKKEAILILAATFVLGGCSDFLTEEPKLSESTELTLSTYEGLNNAVGGAYSPLADGEWYGANYILESELRSGNGMNPTNPSFTSGRYTIPYSLNYNSSSTSGLWGYAYKVISAANNVIEAIDNDKQKYIGSGVTEQDVDNLYAESLAIRALSHFDLLRLYARTDGNHPELGVPVILRTDKTSKETPKRDSVATVFRQVISDLTKAEELMEVGYAREGSDDRAVITVPVIQALLARVYLYDRQYQKAADYATKVINDYDYELWTPEEYLTVWGKDVQPAGGEVIFEVYGIASNEYDEYWEGPSHMTNPLGYADCAASNDLVDAFTDVNDVRGWRGIRGTDEGKAMFCTDKDLASGGQFWTMKYQGKGKGDAVNKPDVNNVIVLRLSEMYLIRAEALVNGASVSGVTALGDLNAIRKNRNAAVLTAAGADAVALERRLELNFEGHRWFDLARTTAKLDYVDGVKDKHLDAQSIYWALPIPKRETDVNPNLVQNQGF